VDDYVLKPVVEYVGNVFCGGVSIVKSVTSDGASIINRIDDIYSKGYLILPIIIILIIFIKKV